jgi:iron complex transport system substrate-binding protein
MSKIFNTTNKKIILGVILLVVIIGGSYGAYTLLSTPESTEPEPTEPEPTETEPEPTETEPEPTETEPEPTETEPEPTETEPEPTETEPEETVITVVDKTGAAVNVTKPVDRIVAIIGTEFICALGHKDKIVGRAELTTDEEAILPSSILELPVVAETSFEVNLELILEQDPDLVLASEGLDDSIRGQLESAGVPVLEESTTFPRRETFIQILGSILDAEAEADAFLVYEAYYEDIVKERVANLTESEKPTVFFEWYMPWFSSGKNGSYTEMINTAGGINIAGDDPQDSMALSPEFVAEADPDMILRMLTFYDGEDLESYQTLSADLLNRTALADTTAIATEQVYIIKNTVLVARRPIGLLYLAKWFHPDLFADIDPAAIHEDYVQTFFGTSVSGVFVYPDEPIEPPEPEVITVVDSTGNQVNVTLPVENIVCLNPGLIELLFALDGEDKIVGRSEGCTFPDSVSEIPTVAGSSYTPNLEMILELEPDFIFADTMLSYKTEELETIRAAGIPVVMESASNFTRMPDIMEYLGLILDNTEKATEILDYMQSYENLVLERVANLTETEKPKVFLEWGSTEWKTFAEGSSTHEILVKAGGINIAPEDSESSSPTLSPEYVTEQDPEVIIRMAPSDSNLTGMQAFREDMLVRPGMSGTTAVAEDRVYLYDSIVFQGLRYPVGLLYWAKWFNPSLFADIDPSEIHAELIQEFFGVELEGTYAYPEIVTVLDGNGVEITINLPVERIVSINSGLTEILSALGCEDRIVGRDQSSTLPPSVLDIPVVAENSYAPNVELILEQEPDIVFADSMLPYNTELYEQLQAAGLTIFIADPSDPEPAKHANETSIDFSCKLVTTISRVVSAEEKADEYITYVQYYNNLVKERIENLTVAERPKVLLEWYAPYNTFVTPGLDQAGGINIAENQTEYAPVLSAEFVVEQDPDIILRSIQSLTHDEADFIDMRDQIMSRPELSEVTAVVTGQVYIYDWAARGGIRCVIGYLYWAKWCQPDLFEDIDPAAVNAEIDQMFFGIEIPGVYAYP